ncbi:MAG TPA: DUF4118 domain-containing protein [Candidatus Scatomonas merdigallinarum]|nr:DUF4118 domain-containing protein [Candidatus Scatomonas merdigallinarum]
MKKIIKSLSSTVFVLSAAFLVSLLFQKTFQTRALIPMIFVLAVFLIALLTQGYFWGILASLAGVLAVNFAFTFPYFEFNFSIPENVLSAAVMLIVAVLTGMLTTKIKQQEKIRAESDREKMRANLLRAVSHDLRTPLTSIYGSCSAILENYGKLREGQQLKLLREMREDAQWLIRMVENLLSVTRIDSRKVEVIKTPTVLEELIDTVMVRFQKMYPEQRVQVEIPEEFISIPMDPVLIEQVLINILENAVFHAEGMTELNLRVSVRGKQAVFEVEDNGCGIPRERLDKIFTGFFEKKGLPSDGRKSNMGIGLSVCAAIIQAHGGTIEAGNREGGGAVFRFFLEREVTDDEQQ